MERVKEILQISREESELVSQLRVDPHRVNLDHSFYEDYAIRGIRVDRVEPGFVSCTFKVPSRLTDRSGILCNGAIANLVDEDELEITSRLLGQKGRYSGTIVLLKNKATGEVIAEGRHSLFGQHRSKI